MRTRPCGRSRPADDASPLPMRRGWDRLAANAALATQYREVLTQLCALTEVPENERPAVLASQSMLLDDIAMHFEVERWSGFIKAFAVVGTPPPQTAGALYGEVLKRQFTMPAPFYLVAGLDPRSGVLYMVGCTPLPRCDTESEELLHLLCTAVDFVHAIRPSLAASQP